MDQWGPLPAVGRSVEGSIMPKVENYAQGTPCWVDLTSSDIEKAKSFYAALFGWGFDANEMGPDMTYYMATLDGSNAAGLMQQMPEAARAPSHWNTYIAVDSVDRAAERITAAGGSLMFPPDEVPGSGRMVLATDPAGAQVGFWEAKGHIGSGVVNQPGAVIWNELQVDEVAAVLPFYRVVAGMEGQTGPAGEMDAYTQFLVGGRSVAGALKKPMPQVPSNWTVYFNVADVDTSVAKAVELGGQILAPAFDVPGIGRLAVLGDPGGAVFALMAGDMSDAADTADGA